MSWDFSYIQKERQPTLKRRQNSDINEQGSYTRQETAEARALLPQYSLSSATNGIQVLDDPNWHIIY